MFFIKLQHSTRCSDRVDFKVRSTKSDKLAT